MKAPAGFRLVSGTLLALSLMLLLHKIAYSAFVMHKNGYMVKYDWNVWKQYWTWIPGKIICIITAVLIILLLAECVCIICRRDKK